MADEKVEVTEKTEVATTEPEVKLAGKFNSPSDLENGYLELQAKLDSQGNELGGTRQQLQVLSDQLAQAQAASVEEPAQAAFADQLQALQQQIEEGDVSVAEGLAKSAEITAAMAAESATENFQAAMEKDRLERVQAAFIQSNPDFEAIKQSGELDAIKNEYPGLHDDFSAFFEYKGRMASNEAFEKGKNEGLKVGQGDKETRTVLPGESQGQEQMQKMTENKPKTPADILGSMAEKLKSYRESSG